MNVRINLKILKRSLSVLLIMMLIMGGLSPNTYFMNMSFAASLPDGVQEFAGAQTSSTFETSNTYFQIFASKAGLKSSDDGFYVNNSAGDAETVYFEVSAANGLNSFNLDSAVFGEYADDEYDDIVVVGYLDSAEVFRTDSYDPSSNGSVDSNYPIDYSPASGQTIDTFRIYYTKQSGSQDDNLAFPSFTFSSASGVSLSDGTQTFTNSTVSEVQTGIITNDGYFKLTGSSYTLNADQYGAYLSGGNTNEETIYFEVTAINGLDNFMLNDVQLEGFKPDSDPSIVGSFTDNTVIGYLDGQQVFTTTPYDEDPVSHGVEFGIDYSPASNVTIDSFRVYYTKSGGIKDDNL